MNEKRNEERIENEERNPFFRKVFAHVDSKTFELFRERTYAEGMKINESFAALVYAYAHGYGFEDGRRNQLRDYAPVRSNRGIDYKAVHASPEPEKPEPVSVPESTPIVVIIETKKKSVKKTKWYVGHKKDTTLKLFSSDIIPTEKTHSEYLSVVGPFKTKRGAEFMVKHGKNNPHMQTVADCERIAKGQA